MKVILLQDVAKIGKRFEVVEVPDGYAMNKLIPKKMAEPATPANLKKIKKQQAEQASDQEARNKRFEAAKEILLGAKIVIKAEANEKGHLFKAVHEDDLVKAAKELGADVDKDMFNIRSQVKEVGEHEVDFTNGEFVVNLPFEVEAI